MSPLSDAGEARSKTRLRWLSKEFKACNLPPGKLIRLTSRRTAASSNPGQSARLAPVCKLASKNPTVRRPLRAWGSTDDSGVDITILYRAYATKSDWGCPAILTCEDVVQPLQVCVRKSLQPQKTSESEIFCLTPQHQPEFLGQWNEIF